MIIYIQNKQNKFTISRNFRTPFSYANTSSSDKTKSADVDNLQWARFISGDYATREPGYISKMRKHHGLHHYRIGEWYV